MIDLIHFVKHFNPYSPHHHAAFNELARHLPPEQLDRHADWVTMYHEEATEWQTNQLNEPSQ